MICFGSRRLRIFGMMPCLQFRTLRQPIAIPQCQTAQFALQTSQDPIFQGYADLTMTWFARFTSNLPNKFDELFCHGGGRARFERKAAEIFCQCRGLIMLMVQKSGCHQLIWYKYPIIYILRVYNTSKRWVGLGISEASKGASFLLAPGNGGWSIWPPTFSVEATSPSIPKRYRRRGTSKGRNVLWKSVCQVASWCENVEWCCGWVDVRSYFKTSRRASAMWSLDKYQSLWICQGWQTCLAEATVSRKIRKMVASCKSICIRSY